MVGEEIRERIVNKPDLVINRVPSNVLNEFKVYAEADFCGDYGMALKYVWDYFKGALLLGQDVIEARLNALEQEIMFLKENLTKKEEPQKKQERIALDGRRMGENK